MDFKESMLEFIDGTLEPGKEEELFFHLSVNEELRSGMKQLLSIDNSIKDNTDYFVPSAESTGKIFSTLGLIQPGVPPAKSGFEFATKAGNFFRSYSQGFMGGLISSVITAAVIFALILPGIRNKENTGLADHTTQAGEISGIGLLPIDNMFILADNHAMLQKSLKNFTVQDRNSINGFTRGKISSKTLTAERKTVTERQLIEHGVISDLNSVDRPVASHETAYVPHIGRIFDLTGSERACRITFMVKGTQYWYSGGERVAPNFRQLFNNTGISLAYNIDEEWSAGLEIRRENFYQKFTGTGENGKTAEFEQQPNFTSYTGLIQYKYTGFGDLRPYIQLQAGTDNNFDMIYRFAAGAGYRLISNVEFYVGLEYSSLLFKYQNNQFASSKYGVDYGLRYSF